MQFQALLATIISTQPLPESRRTPSSPERAMQRSLPFVHQTQSSERFLWKRNSTNSQPWPAWPLDIPSKDGDHIQRDG
eukprot:scaffold567_cov130-Cylindrotheca_fusiformis.AAC.1